ncbi:ribbon-helix-helix protein, CopG family [Dehalobacterium formicoaceticum]|uniref:Ribbon-helix-helix protein, CopG family n=1 Tax=Dehalobacterium formicoaceticum TaxID=51515 RepID=A0ABT1Y2G8_9FIRM|nr:ribbon-helix-helix protein, CopG family [Dehalobacterium formicoaceticum]MCR6545055.1 ribbon-helix-helix protein, CopG family [Dehalobacterium formicoaceticum]
MPNLRRIMISVPDQLLQEFDGIVNDEKRNRSEFIREAMQFYIVERRRRILQEQMKKGYQEMAVINLSIACECFSMESEVFENTAGSRVERGK